MGPSSALFVGQNKLECLPLAILFWLGLIFAYFVQLGLNEANTFKSSSILIYSDTNDIEFIHEIVAFRSKLIKCD